MVLYLFEGRFLLMRLLLLSASVALVGIGVLNIYAVGNPSDAPIEDEYHRRPMPLDADGQEINPDETASESAMRPHKLANQYKKQLAFAGAGFVCLLIVNLFSYERLGPLAYALYGVILLLLMIILIDKMGIMTIPFVKDRQGIHRWIKIGFGFQIQPSEFCKVAFIIALAWYLRFRSNYRKFLGLIGPFALTLLAMVLILLEPDLGTVILMMPILFSMLFVAGAKVKHLIIILCIGMVFSPVMWKFMKGYQRMRISSVLLQNEQFYEAAKAKPWLGKILAGDDYRDKLRTWKGDDGYQLLQSKRAISSGGFWGYGFAKGPYIQNPYIHLPEAHNDMIFATIAHQFGFFGCGLVLLLYAVVIGCAIELAWLNTDPFGRLVAAGIAAMFAVQVIVNVGMSLGLMPLTGLTLPLVSYGGSSLMVNMIAVGLLNNIGRHRPFSVAGKPFEFGSD
ncbi:MAG: FtsW/RodA/SpoVE family cell cycle protein [Planctomycetota bacterium]|jgi:cell division protein FtsW (lipid II flippase)